MAFAFPAELCSRPSYFRCFFQLDFYSPKYLQNGQKIAPKSTKNPVKIASESHARFCIHFYIGFYRFAVCLVLIAKATTCVSYRKIQCFLQVARFTTRAFHMPFPNENERKTVSKIMEKSSKILSNFNLKTVLKSRPIFYRFFDDFWVNFGFQGNTPEFQKSNIFANSFVLARKNC